MIRICISCDFGIENPSFFEKIVKCVLSDPSAHVLLAKTLLKVKPYVLNTREALMLSKVEPNILSPVLSPILVLMFLIVE